MASPSNISWGFTAHTRAHICVLLPLHKGDTTMETLLQKKKPQSQARVAKQNQSKYKVFQVNPGKFNDRGVTGEERTWAK